MPNRQQKRLSGVYAAMNGLEDDIYERATKEILKRNGEKLQRIARGVNAALHLHGNVGAEQHV